MKITPVTLANNSTTFSSKQEYYISKKMFESDIKKHAVSETKESVAAIAAAMTGLSAAYLNDKLKNFGITYCDSENKTINIGSGYNHGFYRIKTPNAFITTEQAKTYLLGQLTFDSSSFGGLTNYINMVNDLKRQDIIQKGLKIHTYELNNNVKPASAEIAAAKLEKFLNKKITTQDLFFIEEDALYYDRLTKTAYSINMNTKSSVLDKDSVLTCKFLINNKNTIGYDCKSWDSYKWGSLETHYTEQQEPSVKLKAVAERDNNKEFAEAFRFGNSVKNYRIKNGIPNVLEHLEKKVRVSCPNEEMLQIVKFYDNEQNIRARICYFDPSRGISFVYNEDGQYMYQLEYNKDHEGNILSCNRI